MNTPLILASSSPFRRMLLTNAGIRFEAESASVDERAVEETLLGTGATPGDVALVLAEAKAQDVAERNPGSVVIGSDQTLSLGDEIFHKPTNMDAARRQLLRLSGLTHQLNSAVVLVRGGTTIWHHVAIARLTVRDLEPGFVGRYLAAAGDGVLSSVGAYQLEAQGVQLFDKIEGDYFSILGLPLLPLLAELRRLGAIDG